MGWYTVFKAMLHSHGDCSKERRQMTTALTANASPNAARRAKADFRERVLGNRGRKYFDSADYFMSGTAGMPVPEVVGCTQLTDAPATSVERRGRFYFDSAEFAVTGNTGIPHPVVFGAQRKQ